MHIECGCLAQTSVNVWQVQPATQLVAGKKEERKEEKNAEKQVGVDSSGSID